MMKKHERIAFLNGKWYGRKIKMLRQMAGVSQSEFSKYLDISQVTLCKYESGRSAPPQVLEKIEQFAISWKVTRLVDLQSEIEFVKTF